MPEQLHTRRFPCPQCQREGRQPADGQWKWAVAVGEENTMPTCLVCGFYPKTGQSTPIEQLHLDQN